MGSWRNFFCCWLKNSFLQSFNFSRKHWTRKYIPGEIWCGVLCDINPYFFSNFFLLLFFRWISFSFVSHLILVHLLHLEIKRHLKLILFTRFYFYCIIEFFFQLKIYTYIFIFVIRWQWMESENLFLFSLNFFLSN